MTRDKKVHDATAVYRLRADRERWAKRREELIAAREEKLAGGCSVTSNTILALEERIKQFETKLRDTDHIDLKTAEEKRGVERKEYTRTKAIESRGLTELEIQARKKRIQRRRREYVKRFEDHAILMEKVFHELSQQHIWTKIEECTVWLPDNTFSIQLDADAKGEIKTLRAEFDALCEKHPELPRNDFDNPNAFFDVLLEQDAAKEYGYSPILYHADMEGERTERLPLLTEEWAAKYRETQERTDRVTAPRRLEAAQRSLADSLRQLETVKAALDDPQRCLDVHMDYLRERVRNEESGCHAVEQWLAETKNDLAAAKRRCPDRTELEDDAHEKALQLDSTARGHLANARGRLETAGADPEGTGEMLRLWNVRQLPVAEEQVQDAEKLVQDADAEVTRLFEGLKIV